MSITTQEQKTLQSEKPSAAKQNAVVSIIIPAYNSADFISETIDSVLAQAFKSYELIIINDGSPDTEKLEKVINSYGNKIVYLKQENRGPSAARNFGIKKAVGEFIAFLDSDDIWLPEFLDEQIKFLQSQTEYDLIYSDAYLFGDSHNAGKRFMDVNPSIGEPSLENLLALRCNVITSGVVVRKEKLLEAGMFDEEHGHRSEDFDLWIRLAKRGVRFSFQKKPLLRYRYRIDSLSSNQAKLHDGALKALDKLEAMGGLSEREFIALRGTRRMLAASKHLNLGKENLVKGEIEEALKNFRAAKENESGWKLNVVLFGLRFFPNLTRRIYLRMQN